MKRFDHRLTRSESVMRQSLSGSPIAHRLLTGAFWSMLGGVASRVFTVLSGVVVARIIGKEGFGEYGMVQSTIGMLGVLAGFGLGATATKFVADARHGDPARAERVANLTLLVAVASGALLAATTFLSSHWLAASTLQRPELSGLLQAASLLLFCSALNNVMLGTLAGFEAFRQVARINLWQGLAAPPSAILLVLAFGVDGAVASLTVNAALGTLLCAAALRGHYRDHSMSAAYHPSLWSEWPVLWRFSLPTMLSGLMVAPVTWLANLFLVSLPGGYGELGLFNAANQWRAVVMLVPGLLASVMLPILSAAHGAGQGEFDRAVSLNLKGTWLFCLPLTVAVMVLNRQLTALFGKAYAGSGPVMVLLMISCFFMIVNNTVGAALAGSGRMWAGFAMNCAWGVSLVAGAWLLVPRMGAFGLALAYLLAYLLHTCWQMLYLELKLACSPVVSQWKLILFSLFVLAAGAKLALAPVSPFAGAALVLVSLVPVLWTVARGFQGGYAAAATGEIV